MTELVLGLAWPVVVAVVAGMAFVGWRLGGSAVKEQKGTPEVLDRLGREIDLLAKRVATVETHASDTRARLRQAEESQERHAALLGKQQKGGQL